MITLTDAAAGKVKELLASEGADDLALRVAVRPGGCSGFSYEMFFDGEFAADDQQATFGDAVKVVVDAQSAQLLDGATLDYKDGLEQSGFAITNPNASRTCGCGQSFSRLAQLPSSVGGMNKPLGPYSPFVRAGDFIIVSGQGGVVDGVIVEGGVTAQTEQTMRNVADRLADAGASLDDVVKTLCFLTDMGTFAEFNEAYAAAFGDHRPARSTVEVSALRPMGMNVEVEAWAYKPA